MSSENHSRDIEVPVWSKPEPVLKFPERLNKSTPARRKWPWRVAPDDKRVRTHETAGSQGTLLAVHPHAVVITSPGSRDLWAAKLGMWLGGVFAVSCLVLFIRSIADEYLGSFASVMAFIAFLLGVGVVNWCYSIAFRTPKEWPVMFNRESRTVHFHRHRFPEFFSMGYTCNSEEDLVAMPWDEVRVRSYRWVESRGGHGSRSLHDLCALFLLWGGEDGDLNLVREMVSIGCQGCWEDSMLFQVWEYVRRYMEEDGPAVPPGETLRKPVEGAVPPIPFPPEVIEAAGGPALSAEEVARMGAVTSTAQAD